MKFFAFEKSVGVVVARKQEDAFAYLLLHYPSGHWDFPKGHVEENETEEETLRRELFEETGIGEIEIVPNMRSKVFYWYKARGKEKRRRIAEKRGWLVFKKVVYYAATTQQKDVQISFEHVGSEWLSFEEAWNKITHANSRKMLEFGRDALKK